MKMNKKMEPVECPKCGSKDNKFFEWDDIHICACGARFSVCPKCGSSNTEPVENFDYVKKCNDCGHEFMGEHN